MLFVTGFPGFLGSELLPRLLNASDDEALCLIQPKFRALAERRREELGLARRIRFVEGDITRPLDHVDAGEITQLWHFAAVYDLAVKRELAMAVNVEGTKRVLDLAARAPKLERLHYISTCYVSGRYDGVFTEDDLEKGQRFNNFYEETKQLAEIEVRRRMPQIPTCIYRPAVTAGDSRTGATQKFDGPYFVLQWLMRQPRIALLPVAGNPKRYTFNVVPSDFVVDALARLASLGVAGTTYALADPEPLTVDQTIEVIAEACGRRVLRVPMPKWLAKGALAHVPGVYRLMRIPPEAVDYFVHPTSYDTTRATTLLGVRPPPLRSYAARLVEYARKHPEVGSAAMV